MNISIHEAAAQAGVTYETARRWTHAGLGHRVGGRWRVDPIKLDRKLHGLPLNPIPNKKLAVLFRQAAKAIEGDGVAFAKPLALVVGEINAWVRGEQIRAEAVMAPECEETNDGTGGVAS